MAAFIRGWEHSLERGVYVGMFEQSMVLDGGASKRSGALAAALMLESAGVAALILIPLIFNQRIGIVRPWMPLTVPILRPVSEPPRAAAASQTQSMRNALTVPRAFHWSAAPRAVPAGPVTISGDLAPAIGGIGGSTIVEGPPLTSGLGISTEVAAPVARAPVSKPSEPQRVGGDVQAAKLIRKVIPVYPELAKRARISGTVRLVGVIAKDGTVEQLQVLSGNPLLVPGAVEAVRQWIYRPTMLDGAAVEVIAPIDVIFTLAQ